MPLSSLVQQATAFSDSGATVTCPAVNAGDLIALADYSAAVSADPGAVTPTDFTAAISTTGTVGSIQGRVIFSYKISDGTEGATSITGMNGTAFSLKALVTFRGDRPIATVTPSGAWGTQFTGSNPTAQSVLASAGAPPLIVFGIYGGNGSLVDPRTFTVGGSAAKDGELAAGSPDFHWLAWKIYMSSPADVSVDMDDEGTFNALHSGWLSVQSAPTSRPIFRRPALILPRRYAA